MLTASYRRGQHFASIGLALATLMACPNSSGATAIYPAEGARFKSEWVEGYAQSASLLADQPAGAALEPQDPPEAPSPWWLVVMPAIPLMGGGLIYAKRRLFGSGLERYEVSSTIASSATPAESAAAQPQKADSDAPNPDAMPDVYSDGAPHSPDAIVDPTRND